MSARYSWAQDLLNAFKEEVRKVREIMTTPPTSPVHGAVTPTEQVSLAISAIKMKNRLCRNTNSNFESLSIKLIITQKCVLFPTG